MDNQAGHAAIPAGHARANRPQPVASVQWRLFIRALAEELDLAGEEERDDMLRGVGRRMSEAMPLPNVDTLAALEIEINETLASVGWGEVQLAVDEARRALMLVHTGLPTVGSLGTPNGQWLAALLPGLYDGWLQRMPGSQPTLHTHRVADGGSDAAVTMRYATW